jgi:hypothetical protein
VLITVLAVLSASAAAGMRIGLPLLVIGLFHSERLWSNLPWMKYIEPRIVLSILIMWSLFELFGSKQLLGQRILQIVQLIFSPIVGALTAIAAARVATFDLLPLWLISIIGGTLALALTLVKVGWFFRLRGIPIWLVVIEDLLCIFLVLLAFSSPAQGGLIALMLLWLAIRSSKTWRDWHREKQQATSS